MIISQHNAIQLHAYPLLDVFFCIRGDIGLYSNNHIKFCFSYTFYATNVATSVKIEINKRINLHGVYKYLIFRIISPSSSIKNLYLSFNMYLCVHRYHGVCGFFSAFNSKPESTGIQRSSQKAKKRNNSYIYKTCRNMVKII